MSKYLIFGATGSIGSKLSEKLYDSNKDVHLIGRDEDELKKLSSKLKCEYTLLDILSENSFKIYNDRMSFCKKIINEKKIIDDNQINANQKEINPPEFIKVHEDKRKNKT